MRTFDVLNDPNNEYVSKLESTERGLSIIVPVAPMKPQDSEKD